MCTVQVLFVADVMRRTPYEAAPAARPSARSICRRLFPDDPSRPSSALLRTLEINLEREVKQKWNFDFKTETPLPGRYQWVPVHAGMDRVHDVVSEIPTTTTTTVKQHTKKPQQNSRSTTTSTQSKITDFLHQRKRHRTSESSFSSSKLKSRRVDTGDRVMTAAAHPMTAKGRSQGSVAGLNLCDSAALQQ